MITIQRDAIVRLISQGVQLMHKHRVDRLEATICIRDASQLIFIGVIVIAPIVTQKSYFQLVCLMVVQRF